MTLESWFENSVIQVEDRVEGMRVSQTEFKLGKKAGPEISNFNLIHEMAHLVEIDDVRAFEPNWGLWVGDPNISDFIPRTAQCFEREARVMGIQAQIMRSAGLEVNYQTMVAILEFLPDYWLQPKSIEDRIEVIKKAEQAWPLQRIQKEWIRKNLMIKEYLE